MKETSVSFGNLVAMSMAYAALKYNDICIEVSSTPENCKGAL